MSTPFFSIWSFDAGALATQTQFWHGEAFTLDLLARCDNRTYLLAGAAGAARGAAAAAQLGLPAVAATSTFYNFSLAACGAGVAVRFTTPQLPADAVALSRPATYVDVAAWSADGRAHALQVLFDAGAEVVAGAYDGEQLEWDRPALPSAATALRMGLVGQRAAGSGFNLSAHMRASTEPHQRQDYGFVYVLADAAAAASSRIALQADVIDGFMATGALAGADAAPPANASAAGPEALVVAAVAFDLGSLPSDGAPSACRATLLVDEVAGILNFDSFLPALWRAGYPPGDASVVPAAAIDAALAEAEALLAAADAFDAGLAAALEAAGGANYSAVAQLVYRQVLGANSLVANSSGSLEGVGAGAAAATTWLYQKEVSSDGDLSTLDVIFPAAPQLLFFERGALLQAAIEPHLFIMSNFDARNRYDQPCALHALGKWPVVEGGNGCSMPMESTGDLLILAAAVTMARGGDASWARPFAGVLRTFARFCNDSLPWPAPQDMTDDFSHAPGNLTNLALKCVIAIGAQAYQEQSLGNASGAALLYAAAQAQGAFFSEHAWSPDGGAGAPHFQFIYNASWSGSYGLMYNALWARVLGLEATVPGFQEKFDQHYAFLGGVTANATWCVPLSSMERDGKLDWNTNTAATAFSAGASPAPSGYSRKVFDQLFFFANWTSSRWPLTDHPACDGPFPPMAGADRARPVLGAFFAPLLVAAPPPAFVAERAKIARFLEGAREA